MKRKKVYMDDLRPIVYLVGIGMGGEDQLTDRVMDCLEMTQVVMGADRMLDSVSTYADKKRIFSAYKPSETAQWLGSLRWDEAVLALSGDTGFYNGAEAAAKAFVREGWDVEFVPGVSSLSYLCARLGKSWQNVHLVNSHGRGYDVIAHIHGFRGCFILLGGAGSVPDLCHQLVNSGMNNVTIWVGENFLYEDEHIAWETTPVEPLMEDERLPLGNLAHVLMENTETAEEQFCPQPGPGDDDYARGQVLMTEKEVRRVSLEKLCTGTQAVCYDIGVGTGPVAAEMGMEIRKRGGSGQVYAIERNREALQLTESNCQKFRGSWMGFHIVEGKALEAMEGLEPPTHVFIGGSGGRIREIVVAFLDANPHVRIAVNAITLKAVDEVLACTGELELATGEITQIRAVPVNTVGSYHMPKAQNSVYMIVMQDPKDDGGETQ